MRSLIPSLWKTPAARNGDGPFASLQSEINRLFDDFGRLPIGRFTAFGSLEPRLNVSETDSAIEIEAELPGLDEKDVEVTVHGELLTIRGEKKEERDEKRKDYHIMERTYGAFSRTIPLPFEADPGSVRAVFNKGVLKVTLAKPSDYKSKSARIPVQRG